MSGEGWGGGGELDEEKRVQTTLLDHIYIYVCVLDHSI